MTGRLSDFLSSTHRVRDTVKALTREQEKLLGQLKEVQADKEQSEVRAQGWFAFSIVHPVFIEFFLSAGHQRR